MGLIQVEIPDVFLQQAQSLVQHGWTNNLQQLVAESLHRYLESQQEKVTEQFIQDDVTWGLYRDD